MSKQSIRKTLEEIGNYTNLQIITGIENRRKGTKCV
jgi:hypothetical protein